MLRGFEKVLRYFYSQGGHAAFALIVEKMAMPRPGNEKGMLGGTEVCGLVLSAVRVVCVCLWVFRFGIVCVLLINVASAALTT